MVERFFFSDRNVQILDEHESRITLVSGPPSSGKSSLLFQFAYNSALKEDNSTVIILCNSRVTFNPPLLSQGVDPSSEIFSRIRIKYVDDDQGINNYFAALHLHDVLPASIIIDDFADFFAQSERYNNPRGRELAMVHALALCRNAIDHANAKGRCQLLLSDTHKGDPSRLLYIYKRWVSSIYTIYGDGSGLFILENCYHHVAMAKRMKSAKYSIAHQYLVLKGID
ncbi:hypothetical protein F511_10746 [Dorcoceras hygrometricum]|uniref:Uncharacterized protein n=1 Tax=Dorcoceras hygrometricum TaxID=472368 RepID=A0A2Z7CBM6_9LAMI|nr:hypothetical protein F511_10746 [Dorcoceras hygrometricum]